jgi:hypothetical protein
LRYLHRKKELHPGILIPGTSFFLITASAIFIKNCDISERDRLIFFPCSCSSFVFFMSACAPEWGGAFVRMRNGTMSVYGSD